MPVARPYLDEKLAASLLPSLIARPRRGNLDACRLIRGSAKADRRAHLRMVRSRVAPRLFLRRIRNKFSSSRCRNGQSKRSRAGRLHPKITGLRKLAFSRYLIIAECMSAEAIADRVVVFLTLR